MPKAGFGWKLYQVISDGYNEYVKWLNWSENMPTVQMLEEECRKHRAEFILRDFIHYLIIDKSTDEVVGRCAFPSFQANWAIPQFRTSYFVWRSKRSKSYATETAHAMALLAFRILQAKKLEIHCDCENIASTKIPLKLGFKREYIQRGSWTRQEDQLAELQTYSIFYESELTFNSEVV